MKKKYKLVYLDSPTNLYSILKPNGDETFHEKGRLYNAKGILSRLETMFNEEGVKELFIGNSLPEEINPDLVALISKYDIALST